MKDNLLVYLLFNISLMLLVSTMLTEIKPLRNMIKQQNRSDSNQLILGIIFGLMSILCTYTGLRFQGAVVNTRVISTLAAGLVGGPLTGISAGALGGIHRYFYHPTGFTTLACSIGTVCFGVIGALAHQRFNCSQHKYGCLVALTVFSELLQCVIVLVLAKPFSAAMMLEKAIFLPKILMNSAGMVVFMVMLDRLNRNLTFELVEQRSIALLIAQECLPYLRDGLSNRHSLQKAMDTVRTRLPAFKVAISDCNCVLAASGTDLTGKSLPDYARQAVESRKIQVDHSNMERGRLRQLHGNAAIAAPLIWEERAVGTLILLAPMGPNMVLEADLLTAESLAQFFAAMLELGELQHQIALRQQAEFRALQAQINPHFFFNVLNTISALCLTDPDRARDTLLVLARYFRQSLSINESFVTLQQELDNVENYLFLTAARFEDALHVTWDLPDDRTALRLPPLLLQPVVENAVRHGGVAVDDRRVHIQIRQDSGRAYVEVRDEGKGFPDEVLKKIQDPHDPTYTGLFNVRKRLRSIYGEQCQFAIRSSSHGSTVAFSIPLKPPVEVAPLP